MIGGAGGRTIVRAALAAFSFGRGFSTLGAGGGRAAIWGEAASGEREDAAGTGTTTGVGVGESDRDGCFCWGVCGRADMSALVCVVHGYRNGRRVDDACRARCNLLQAIIIVVSKGGKERIAVLCQRVGPADGVSTNQLPLFHHACGHAWIALIFESSFKSI